MHSVPGLVVLHSKDLVNWEFSSYCFDRFDDSDDFNLRNGVLGRIIKVNGDIYDLSVLFDEDGKIYAVHKYGNVTVTELKPDLVAR